MTILKDFISETAFAQQIDRHPATVERWRKNGSAPRFVMLGKTPSPNGSEQASGPSPKTKRLTGHLQARRTVRKP